MMPLCVTIAGMAEYGCSPAVGLYIHLQKEGCLLLLLLFCTSLPLLVGYVSNTDARNACRASYGQLAAQAAELNFSQPTLVHGCPLAGVRTDLRPVPWYLSAWRGMYVEYNNETTGYQPTSTRVGFKPTWPHPYKPEPSPP